MVSQHRVEPSMQCALPFEHASDISAYKNDLLREGSDDRTTGRISYRAMPPGKYQQHTVPRTKYRRHGLPTPELLRVLILSKTVISLCPALLKDRGSSCLRRSRRASWASRTLRVCTSHNAHRYSPPAAATYRVFRPWTLQALFVPLHSFRVSCCESNP